MNTLSLTPLMRHSVGFDRINHLFDNLAKLEETAPSYPPYNIEKCGENDYEITMAVAGFAEEDLNITQEGGTLTIQGRIMQTQEDKESAYLHKGIATRAFERKFNLDDHVKVLGAQLEHGLLKVQLQREIPEEKKPRTIAIGGASAAKKLSRK